LRGRLEAAAAAHALTPFVGREDELRSLMNRWERALDSEGQVALIIGEAGIGKSRLMQRFREQIAGTPHTWVEAAAGAFFQNTPFYAVTEMLRELLAWRGDEPAEEQLTQLEPSPDMSPAAPAMKELVQFLARQLVNNPDAVEVKEAHGDTASVLELRVAKEDLGRVIGKQGRTVKSIRTILNAVASRTNRKVVLEIIQEK